MFIIPHTNAKSFSEKGYALTLEEENLTAHSLIKALDLAEQNKLNMIKKMRDSRMGDALTMLVKEIKFEVIDDASLYGSVFYL
ncbi:glycosyltransferase [Cytobacillus dafuensis]|uniref:Glycosyl transferase family 28 C-terminal domain-containing protein n=1 Tax=Cytobacillus dafuensis TaxID=1742359 RepID=A0A5B8Z918_CYTDA|nr:glycosyltransferase [Cytobacillus dafuensis]QED47946.1 hypothetical protein FSZ17_12205 [Cytobacillus dafuensis]